MYELLSTEEYMKRRLKVSFSRFTGEWSISNKSVLSRNDVAAYETYGTPRASAYKILEDTLNLRDVRLYDTVQGTDGKEKRVLNSKATMLAQQKQQSIKNAFREWIWKEPERRHRLVKWYNELFNATRPREYDGSPYRFCRNESRNYAQRTPEKRDCAHAVRRKYIIGTRSWGREDVRDDSGCYGIKKTGLCTKSMIVVPNHLTEQWASEFLRLYPNANILVATKRDFEKGRRSAFARASQPALMTR